MVEEAKEDVADVGVGTNGHHLQIISKCNKEEVDAELEHSFHRRRQHLSCMARTVAFHS